MRHVYHLELTEDDLNTIHFVGGRYSWSEALSQFGIGDNPMMEHEAWSLSEAFEADTEGGHSPFPMLRHDSDLATKLFSFWDSIV